MWQVKGLGPMSTLNETASWVVRDRLTKAVQFETFDRRVVDHLKPQYEAVPILEYLQSLNQQIRDAKK